MKKAALYIQGRVIVGDSHLEAFRQMTVIEQQQNFVSGFFDFESSEFESDLASDHFYDKEMLLIRHSETTGEGYDPPLSENGRKQAETLARALNSISDISTFSAITSPMLRCLETTRIIARAVQLKFKVQENLVETPIDIGPDESYVIPDRSREFSEFDWPERSGWCLKEEHPSEFIARIKLVLRQLPKRCIVVTHFGCICHLTQLSLCHSRAKHVIEEGIPHGSIMLINREHAKTLGRIPDAKDCQGRQAS